MIFLLVAMKNLSFFCENYDFNGSSVNDEFDRPISADEARLYEADDILNHTLKTTYKDPKGRSWIKIWV